MASTDPRSGHHHHDHDDDTRVVRFSSSVTPDHPATPGLLAHGEVEVLGRMPYSSNGTFLVQVSHGEHHTQAIYKPVRGERPLWDFPPGLHRREVAAYELSEALGWRLVPPTVLRDGPLGEGSLQLFIPAAFDEHYFTLSERDELRPTFRRLCAFDFVANNTDRKGGHCLLDEHGHVWAIDHGLSFHADFKLRTVIWDFAGEPVPSEVVTDLQRLLDEGLSPALAELLDPFEREALRARARALVAEGRFPVDHTGRRYPWPLV